MALQRSIGTTALLLLLAALLGAPVALRAQGAPAPSSQTAQPPAITLTAWVFGNYQMQYDDATKAANGGHALNKFDMGRAYLTFQGPLGDRTAFRVTTDLAQGGATADYKGWFVRMKYAYLQYQWLKP